MSWLNTLFSPVKALVGAVAPKSSFNATGVPVLQPVTQGQANASYDQTQSGLAQQQAFLQALQGQNGIQNQSNVYNQLQGVANGTGPNPALQQLQNTTGQNVANQAALMASQRGVSSNPALLARQVGQQGAGIQQQAAGQGAALQAQQQLEALSQLGGIAGQQVGNLAGAQNAYNQYAQGEQNNLLNSLANYNQSNVGMQSNINSANAGIGQSNAQAQGQVIGGIFQGAGAAVGLHKADGGMIPASAGRSSFSQYLNASDGAVVPGQAKVSGDSLKNDTVPAMLSPGEIVIPRHIVNSPDPVSNSAQFVQAILARHGRR